MKQANRVIVIIVLLFISVYSAQAQKTFSKVYISTKEGDGWSGLKKSAFGISVTDVEMAGIYVITMTEKSSGSTNVIPIKFEAMAGEGKAFHKIVTTDPFSYDWTGPSGETKINWVYVNANIKDIYDASAAPFDFEIQFEGGTAAKYYVSP